MFDDRDVGVGLWPGEGTEFEAGLRAEDDLAYVVSSREPADDWVEPEQHFLPGGLEVVAPGPYLAAIVSSVDPSKLNGHDAVRLMQARARLAAHEEAGKLAAIAEVAFSPPGDAWSAVERSPNEIEYSAAEIAAALTLTRRASEGWLDRALTLSRRLWRVRRALSEGRIDIPKVRVFDRLLGHLPDTTVDEVLDRILDDASGLTTGQLRARIARLVLEVDPDGSRSAFEEGLRTAG